MRSPSARTTSWRKASAVPISVSAEISTVTMVPLVLPTADSTLLARSAALTSAGVTSWAAMSWERSQMRMAKVRLPSNRARCTPAIVVSFGCTTRAR